MKTFFKTILVAIVAMCSFSVHAEEAHKYFDEVANKPNFDYTYISPAMLRSMGGRYLNEADAGGIQLNSHDLTSIETISTPVSGEDADLWKIIRQIKKDKKLENLSTKKKDYYRYDMLGRTTKDGEFITHLMIITQNGSDNVSVIYIEGKIPIAITDLSFL